MGVSPAIFESAGKRTEHIIPGAYSRSSNVLSPVGLSAGNLVILGTSLGGEPLKLLKFSNLEDAKNELVGGELLKGLAFAFSGSRDYIPQNVSVMRVNKGSQAERTLKSGDVSILKVKSWDWGSHANQLKMWIKNGSLGASYRKITVAYKDSTIDVDNIQKPSLSIAYIGEGENPTCTITNEGIYLSATLDSETVDEITVPFADFSSLSDVVTYINDQEVYQAVAIDVSTDALASDLDTCAGVSIADEGGVFYSNLKAFVDALKTIPFIGEVEIVSNTERTFPDVDTKWEYFEGGKSGESSWSEALAALEVEDVQIIATPSTDVMYQSSIVAHCIKMSNTVNRKERTCILGGAFNESDDTAIENARSFNSNLVSYVTDSGTAINPITNKVENVSGALLGCMLAGMESAMPINEPLTFKTVNLLSFTKRRTVTNIENLIKNGVLVCNPNPENLNEYICIRGVTTYQGEGDLISCERSMVRESLYMDRDLRKQYGTGIGHPNTLSVSDIVQTLKDTARSWVTSGYIIPNGTDAVWNVSVRYSGDKVYLKYSRYLTAPRNFMFITATNHVYESEMEL